MAQLAVSIAGAAVGFALGGPTGAQIGWAAGSLLGSSLGPTQQGPRLNDTKVQISSYGAALPIIYGGTRVAGNVIWSTDLNESSTEQDGKGGPSVETFSYSVSCAVAICEGPIGGVRKIWADSKLVYDASDDAETGSQAATALFATYFTLYTGSETQLPDPTIETAEGVGNVEAYRGTAYIVFQDLPLAEYGNRIPNFTFETSSPSVEVGTSGTLYEPLRVFPWGAGSSGPPSHGGDNLFNGFDTIAEAYEDMLLDHPDRPVYIGYYIEPSLNSLQPVLDRFEEGGGTGSGGSDEWGSSQKVIGNYSRLIPGAVNDFEPVSLFMSVNGYLGGLYPPDGNTHLFKHLPGSQGVVTQAFLGELGAGWSGFDTVADSYAPEGINFYVAYLVPGAIEVVRVPSPPPPTIGCPEGDPCLAGEPCQVPGNSAFCISCTGDVTRNITIGWSRFTGTFKQLAAVEYRAGVLYQNGLGPVLLPGDPNYSNSTYWDNQRALAITAGTMRSDVSYAVEVTEVARGIVSPGGGPTADEVNTDLATIVTDVCERAGLSSAQIDVTELDDVVMGYKIARQMQARAAIEPLRQAWYFDAVENGEVIQFVKRGGATVFAITADDIGASEGDEVTPLTQPRRAQETELPAEVNVAHEVREADYQVGTQQSKRVTTGSQQVIGAELPIVMPDAKGAQVADVLMYDAWAGRTDRTFTSTRKFTHLLPTDVGTVNDGEFTYTGRLIEKTEDGPLIRWVLRDADPASYSPNSTASTTSGGGSAVRFDGPMKLELMDLPALRLDDSNAGIYAAAAGYRTSYRGGRLYKSVDGTNYNVLQTMNATATLGYATTVLGDFTGGNIVDEANTVTVSMHSGTLSSVTSAELLNGANLCLLGDELLMFHRATLVSAGVYTLTGLLRGRFGTEQHMATHAVDDRFVFLVPTSIYRVAQETADIGAANYKGVAYGTSVADATAVEFENTAAALKPLSVSHLQAIPAGGGNYTVQWIRRARYSADWRDLVDAPLCEGSEAYSVEVERAGSVISTTTVTAQTATVAATTADTVRVYQLSELVGRGFAAEVTI